MPNYEQLGQDAVARLSAPITNVATSLTVTSASGFPTAGNFRITVSAEVMLVTAVSGTTFTVVRGQEGTSGVAHDGGSTVICSFTSGAMGPRKNCHG